MKINLSYNETEKLWIADIEKLPGSPPIGKAKTKHEAVAFLLGYLMSSMELGRKFSKYINWEEPITCEIAEKPPLGIAPEWLYEEKRIKELIKAITRYIAQGKYSSSVSLWCNELAKRITNYNLLRK